MSDVGSLAYRQAREDIQVGRIPRKYTRLLPYIEGDRILEIGAAEGVLSLLLAERGAHVTAMELREERHLEAKALQARWLSDGRQVGACRMCLGDIREHLSLLQGIDTLVAVRTVYYLRDDAPRVFEAIAAAGVSNVVLCGNANRAARYHQNPHDELGHFNRFASLEGMRQLLHDAGYLIVKTDEGGDPVVVGAR